MIIKKDSTDITSYVNLVDSTAGTPETGLTITGIDATYTRNRAAAVKNDLTALAAVDSAHADNKGIEVDATNAPGIYRIDWPDAAFATGVDKVILTVNASGVAPAHIIVQLVNYNPEDGVRLGLTALPNAAAEAAGGLYTRGSGAGQINQPANGLVDVNVENWNTTAVPAEHSAGYPIVTIKDGTGTGEINTNAGAIALVDLVTTTTTATNLTNAPTAGDLTATMKASVNAEVDTAIADARLDELLAADSDIDGAAPPTVGSVFHELMSKTAGSFTYDQTTDSNEAIRDKLTDIETDTAEIGTAGAGLTNINLPNQTMDIVGNITGNLSGSVGSVTGAVGSVTGAVGSVTGNVGGNVTGSVGSLATQAKSDVNAEVLDVLNTDTFAEPGQEAPGATISLVKKIGYLFKAWRNKSTQTSTQYTLYADDTTTVDQKGTVSDDGTTFTRNEIATGP